MSAEIWKGTAKTFQQAKLKTQMLQISWLQKNIEHTALMKQPNPISLPSYAKLYSHLFSNLVRTFKGSNDKDSKWKGKNWIPRAFWEHQEATFFSKTKVKQCCLTFYDVLDLDYSDKFFFLSCFLVPCKYGLRCSKRAFLPSDLRD